MARLEVRLSFDEKERVIRAAVREGLSLSDYVRKRLLGAPEAPAQSSGFDAQDAVEDHERRLARLEEMANL
jgi:uncharacterized protein (DUF1778 family)